MTTAIRADPKITLWLAIFLATLLHLASAGWHVRFGALNADEGFYAIGTRSVADGEMPYRDFGFTQPPGVLYANALPLKLTGFGLFPQRVINGLWATIALVIAARWLGRRTQPMWGIGLAVLFSLSAPWMYFIHLGKTYGLTTLWVMLATWVFLAMERSPRRNFLLGLIGVLGIGTRLPAAPFFVLLGLFAWGTDRRPSTHEIVAMIGGVILGASLVVFPFWLAAPEAARFWIFDFHRASVPLKDWSLETREIVGLAPAVWLLTGIVFTVAIWRRLFLRRETGVMLAAVITLGANLLPGGTYQEYGVPFLLPLAVVAMAMIHEAFGAGRSRALPYFVGALAAVHVFVAPLLSSSGPIPRTGISRWLPPAAPPYNRLLPSQLVAARQVVQQALPSQAPFIGPQIILAAETGRHVPRGLRMGPFSFTVEIPPERADRLHLVTHEKLDAWFADPQVTLLAFFKRRELNYGWSMPSFDQLRPEFHAQWFSPIRRDFAVAYEGGDFQLVVRKNRP